MLTDMRRLSMHCHGIKYTPRVVFSLARGSGAALGAQPERTAVGVFSKGIVSAQPLRHPTSLHKSRFSVKADAKRGDKAVETVNGAVDVSNGRVIETELRLEAEQSYMAYAMSVIVGRALPDVRDGLKPVQRRILYAMHELGLAHNKPFRKCARVVGEVLGKYHPHGDSSVYEAMVRMAQDFSLRAPLIDGHGNFGSIDDDPPAAMRYTECRLQSFASGMLLSDLAANTVDYAQNFDASQEEPIVLPARIPHVLVNGAAGIAVGIATKIPPHNMKEIVAGLKALIKNPDITIKELMRCVPAPDFPTGGLILMTDGVRDAYEKGRGSVTMRGRLHTEEVAKKSKKGATNTPSKELVVITELPYQVYKAGLVEHIADLIEGGVITGVSDVRDESDRKGMRIVIELKRGSNPQLIINNLYKHTQLQTRFSANMVALVDGVPKNLNLKEFLHHFLEFRCEVVIRRTTFELEKSQKRLHIVEGFLTAIRSMDDVVKTIRSCRDTSSASAALQDKFGLSGEQAAGVLNMSLGRLTSLEEAKLSEEKDKLIQTCSSLNELLGSKEKVLKVVEFEAQELVDKHGSKRKTELVMDDKGEISEQDIIPNEPCVITFSKKGYIKRMPADTFTAQHRGGKGKAGARLKGDDTMDVVVIANTHDNILFFTEDGIARSLPAYHIPQSSRTAQGTAIGQVLPVSRSNSIAAIMAVSEFKDEDYLILLTERGIIKKTSLSQFENIRSTGMTAMKMKAEDRLRWVSKCTSGCEVLIGSSCGYAIRFATDNDQLRPLGRPAAGVVALRLKSGCRIVGMSVLPHHVEGDRGTGPWVLLVTAKGLGKRVPISEFGCQARGGLGTIAIKLRVGDELAALQVAGLEGGGEEILMCTAAGVMCRTALHNVNQYSRTAKGTRLLKLQDGDEVQAVSLIRAASEDSEGAASDEESMAEG